MLLARTLVTSALAISLAGCFPFHFVERPGISGTVVDGATSTPVANATVALHMRTMDGRVGSTISATTDAGGVFFIPVKRKWGVYIIPMDFVGYFGTADIEAPGYLTVSREVRSSPVGAPEIPLGDVRVTRAQ